MGYTSGWSSIKDITDHILRGYENSQHLKLIDHKSTDYGRTLWVAVANKDGLESWISVYKISSHEGDFGYKDMSEDMHPFYYNCPLSLLNKTTGFANPNSKKWREEVRLFHAIKKEKNNIAIGTTVKVYGEYYEIVDKRKKTYIGRDVKSGARYKLKLDQIELIKENAENFILNKSEV